MHFSTFHLQKHKKITGCFFSLRPPKNNCVVRVTAAKTLGRVGSFLRWLTCWMTKKRLSSWEQFRILRVRSSAAFSHFGLKIFSKTLTESITLTQKWGKNTKNRVIESETGSGKMRSYTIYSKWLKRLFQYYRTVPNRIANCTEQYRDFFIIFFYRTKKK